MELQSIIPNFYKDDNQKTMKELYAAYVDLRDNLEFLLKNLDEENVVRAKSVIADWVYTNILDASQVITGKLSAERIDTENLHAKSAEIAGSVSADNITAGTITALITIIGAIITGGTFRTAEPPNRRVEISESQIRTYNDQNNLNGFVTDNIEGHHFGDWKFYIDGNLAFTVYNGLDSISFRPEGFYNLNIGLKDKETYMRGNMNFTDNVTGVYWEGTTDDFNAKADFKAGQLIHVTDETIPTLDPNLPEDLVAIDVDTADKTAAQLSATNKQVNKIADILRERKLGV